MRTFLMALNANEGGQGLMEYMLLLSLASIVSVAALTALGNTVCTTLYEKASTLFSG